MRVRVGISSCLLGHEVRYDGAHTHCAYIADNLSEYFEFVPLCPEVAIGMGTPRPPIQLVETLNGIRALGVDDASVDMTSALHDYGQQVCDAHIRNGDICGYIFKQNSPSCGVSQVKVFDAGNRSVASGRGIYADSILAEFPHLPVAGEHALLSLEQRESFVASVMDYYHKQQQRRS